MLHRLIHRIFTTFLPLTIAGTMSAAVYTGNCGANGNNATYKLDTSTGVLTISGTGAIADYGFAGEPRAPWYNYSADVKTITINSGITRIGENTFHTCKNLTSASLPNTVTTIGVHAFAYCKNLKTVNMPTSLQRIESAAFYQTAITSVTIPSNVTYIANQVFEGCTALKTVKFNTTKITYLNNRLFAGCTSLTSITIPNNITEMSSEVFRNCTALKTVNLSSNLTNIGSSTFYGCTALTGITIPSKVTTIGSSAFGGCTALTTITIPANVSSVGNRAFEDCSALKTVKFNTTKITSFSDYLFCRCTNLTTVNIPSSVTSFGIYVFRECSSISSMTIPNTVTSIGKGVFYDCGNMTAVTLSNKLTTIPEYTFYSCENLKSITIPSSVTSIGSNAFAYCSAMTKVTMTNNITSIGSSAFCGCDGLTAMPYSSKVTKIEDDTYYGCDGFTSITIPSTITSIGEYAFRECSNVTTVTIPTSVKSIGKEAFYGHYQSWNSKVTDIYVSWTTASAIPEWTDISWTSGVTLHIPCGTGTVYRAKEGWNRFTIIGKTQYNLTVQSANATMGTVKIGSGTASGSVTQNTYCEQQVTLTAVPAAGYHFTKWSNNSTSNPVTITMPSAATTYNANFAATTYTITVTSNNTSLGTATGGGSYQEGKTATLTATPKNCTTGFVQWNDGNTDNPRKVTVNAAASYQAQFAALSGNCGANGNNLTWSLNRCTGVLTISGNGAMKEWTSATEVPWCNYRATITSVTLPVGLTSIGAYAFYGCAQLSKIDIPAAVRSLGKFAFALSGLKELYIPEGITALPEGLLTGGASSLSAPIKRIYLPTTLTSIGSYSIQYNPLQVLTYPISVTTLGSTAYRAQYPAKEVYASWTTNIPSRAGRIELVTSPKLKMHIPYGTKALYQAKDWNRIYDLVEDFDERAIDLGLSIRWASCNIGATTPEQNGNFYAWGDTLTRSSFTWTNYPYSGTATNTLTKYNTRTASGVIDNRSTLIAFDDAAYINWGETWRMPTWAEWNELITKCTWKETTLNGVAVWQVTGPNGNSIYLPKVGYKANSSVTSGCYYWSSSLNTATTNDGCNRAMYINAASRTSAKYGLRYVGMPVRAVYRREWPSFTLTITDTPNGATYTKAINATATYTLTAQEDDCHRFVRWSDGNTQNPRTVTVTANATYTAQFERLQFAVTASPDDNTKGNVTIEKEE